jgi:type II secretory pathway pseudopilin PulG
LVLIIIIIIIIILPAALGPGVYSASNRNEYQKQKNVSGE